MTDAMRRARAATRTKVGKPGPGLGDRRTLNAVPFTFDDAQEGR